MFLLVKHLVPAWGLNLLLKNLVSALQDVSCKIGFLCHDDCHLLSGDMYEIVRPFQSMLLYDALCKRLSLQAFL